MPQYTILSLNMGKDFDGTRDDIPANVKEAYLDASFGKDVSGAVNLDLYKATAVVEAADLEDLFVKTQHIEESWDEVKPPVWSDGPLRSTSVGDAIINNETYEVFSCDRLGWTNLKGESADALRALRVDTSSPAPGA